MNNEKPKVEFFKVEPKRYRFLLEESKTYDLMCIGRGADDSYALVEMDKFKAYEILGDDLNNNYTVSVFPKHYIDEHIFAEIDDVVIVDFVKVKVEDLEKFNDAKNDC
jgi:hypothetical protein